VKQEEKVKLAFSKAETKTEELNSWENYQHLGEWYFG